VKLGKNRTEADMRLYTEERDRLEREKEEIRSSLVNLKKERRETKEELSTCQGTPSTPCAGAQHIVSLYTRSLSQFIFPPLLASFLLTSHCAHIAFNQRFFNLIC
jgi:hypothetical protein